MRIGNNTVKINNNNYKPQLEKKLLEVQKKGVDQPSFKGGGNLIISTMDFVDRGGLFASFLIQDFFGMNIPRTATGLYRNSDITGELNYLEAAEVAIREFLSGPVMFAVPMLMIWGIKRAFGKANDVPVDVIRAMGDKYAQYAAGQSAEDLSNVAKVKSDFYKAVFKDVLTNAHESNTTANIDELAGKFAKDVIEYENLLDSKKTTKFVDKLKGIQSPGTADAKLSQIIADYANIVKENATTPSKNFLDATLSTNGNDVSKSINKLMVDMRNFTEDAVESIAKHAKNGGLEGKDLGQFFERFTNFRAGSRILTNLSMLTGTIIFCSIIPKLYQLSKTNPGLKGIEGKTDNAQTQNGSDTNKLNDKPEGQPKQIAFSGAVDSLGKIVTKKDGKIAKFFNEFEFDSYNLSFMGFLTACGIGVLLPRLAHAREENEYKEILFRDTVTIGAIACLAKCVQQMVARACTKATGFALALKPKFEAPSKLKEYLAYLRPVKGHKVLNSEQLQSKYTNIDKYKGGIADFARFIDEQGGDVRKMMSIDKNTLKHLEQAYNLSSQAKKVEFSKAGNKEIIEAMQELVSKNKDAEPLKKIYDVFKNNDNVFLKKAKIMNSSFNFAILFLIAPLVFGWAIPRLNESLTKKRQMEKMENGEDTQGSKVNEKLEEQKSKAVQLVDNIVTNNLKKSIAFKEFIKQ